MKFKNEMKKKIFISYCHQERALVRCLIAKLKQFEKMGLAEIWSDDEIFAGSYWKNDINSRLRESDIILYCVSFSFLGSSSCEKEINIGRKLKKEKNVVLIPIILSGCNWKKSPTISALQALPTDGKPVLSYKKVNLAFQEIYEGIKRIINLPNVKTKDSFEEIKPLNIKMKDSFEKKLKVPYFSPIFIDKVREIINDDLNLILSKKDKKGNTEFGLICSIMDRIDDLIRYLNDYEIIPNSRERHAFDFSNFINNASTLINCVNKLAEIFECDFSEMNTSAEFFNKSGSDGEGSDKKYFEYIRSICAVHPEATTRHKTYQKDMDAFECSPFSGWEDDSSGNPYLKIWIYSNNNDSTSVKTEKIYPQEVFNYVTYRYELLKEIIPCIRKYKKGVLCLFQKRKIKTKSQFKNYIDYLENLKEENKERFPDDEFYELKFAIRFFALKLTNPKNQKLYDKYANALRYAIQFKHRELQNMTTEGFKNCGLKDGDSDNYLDSTLLEDLLILHHNGVGKYFNPVSKSEEGLDVFSGLSDCNPDYPWQVGYYFSQAKPFLKKYVSFDGLDIDNKNDSFEFLALIKMALYRSCLRSNCIVNRNIPNDLKYRFKLMPGGTIK